MTFLIPNSALSSISSKSTEFDSKKSTCDESTSTAIQPILSKSDAAPILGSSIVVKPISVEPAKQHFDSKKVTALLPAGGQTPVAPSKSIDTQEAIREEVAKYYVLKEHMPAIEDAVKERHCIISIRQTGELTLKRLALGASAKGHDILEKTIKEKSIRSVYPPEKADAIWAALEDADLLGYVGCWDEENHTLLGIYIDPEHPLGDLVVGGIYKIDLTELDASANNADGAYRVDIDKLNASLAPLKAQENWPEFLVTGDYDLLDMASLIGRRGTVPSDSREERLIIKAMNTRIAKVDPKRLGKRKRPVQHGPQVSGVAALMWRKESVPPAVAKADFPLACVHKGVWTIVRNKAEHLAFYKKHSINMKSRWLSEAEAHVPRRHSH